MNILDIIIVAIIAISAIYGLYRGFVHSLLSLGASIVSIFASLLFLPGVVKSIFQNPKIVNWLVYFTDSDYLIGNIDMSKMSVLSVDKNYIGQLLDKLKLASPLNSMLESNIKGLAFKSSGALNLGDYVSQTILTVAVNIVSFIAIYFICFIIISVFLNILRIVFSFPLLKQLDGLLGMLMGVMRGIIFVFILFAVVPIIQSTVPLDFLRDAISNSHLAPIFQNSSFIINIMNNHI